MYIIEPYKEHVVIRDKNTNNIVCHCDNYNEAKEEIEEMEVNNNG